MAPGALAAAPSASTAQALEAALDQRDYPAALKLARPLAEQGDAQAYYNLGSSYEAGVGVPQDFRQAAAWYKQAAAVVLRAWTRSN